MEIWAKECCIEQFQFRLCEQIYQVIAKSWLILVHFDSFIGKYLLHLLSQGSSFMTNA